MRALFLLLLLAPAWSADQTALDEYVHRADPAFGFDHVRTLPGDGVEAHVIELTSQTWLTPEQVDRTAWKHWLVVYQPERVSTSTALLLIAGGSNASGSPEKSNPSMAAVAAATRSVVAELRMVPNQPLVFADDEFGPRDEDEIIAFNWRRFLETKDDRWLTRLPMTKSAVSAMDAVEEFMRGRDVGVENFFVMGGSKRGWTTWTTAAVDERVIGISPIVIDMLNLVPSFVHHYRVYGFWAPAVTDYFREGIMDRFQSPEFAELLDLVEPYSYRSRMTMPKFLINSAGDQFFLPDSSQFYFDDLPGEKYLRYVPNSDHSLKSSDALESLTAFYHALINDLPRPRFSWELLDDGGMRIVAEDAPSAVKLWTAHNPDARDFRLESVGPIYRGVELKPERAGSFSYETGVAEQEQGWTAYFVELTFPSGIEHPFKFTTPVRVVPDAYPHEAPVPGRTKVGPVPPKP